jgi:hypothetical protein
MSAIVSGLPIASPRSSRSCFISAPVTAVCPALLCESDHMVWCRAGLYRAHWFKREAPMRRLIESLTPQDRKFYWKWVGSMFVFYVVAMVVGTGVFIGHQSSRKLANEYAVTAAVRGKQRPVAEARVHVRQAADYDSQYD